MSSYLSHEYKIQPPQSSLNVQLVDKTLSSLQGRYDTNKALIDQAHAQYKNQLKGVRDIDNEYIASKFLELDSVINQQGLKNVNLAFNSNRDAILQTMSTMLEDPIIQNALTSKSNYLDLQKQKEELFKKDPKLYNDLNLQDALDQGGFKAFMNGETKKLGQMRLTPYTDVQKELNDRLGKWAKEHGYEKTVDIETGEYFFKTTKGKRLSEDKIKTFLRANLDPTMAQQMQINARQTIGKMPNEDYQNYVAENLKNNISKYEKELVRQEALKSVVKGDNVKILEENITGLKEYILDSKTKLKNGNFSKDLQYDLYNNNLFDGFAKSYARNMITDISFSDEPLKVLKYKLDLDKFEADKEYKRRDLELKEYGLDGKDSQGSLLSSGTVIPALSDQADEGKYDFDLIEANFKETDDNLKQVLAIHDPTYQSLKTDEERSEHINTLMANSNGVFDPTNTTMNPNVVAALDRHRNNHNVYRETIGKIKSTLDKTISNGYNSMIGAKGLELGNLAYTMPETVKAIKENKKFNELDPITQDKLKYERVVNQLQFDNKLSRDDRKNMTEYAARIASKYSNDKDFSAFVEKTGDKEYISFFGGIGEAFKGSFNNLRNIVSSRFSQAKFVFNHTFGNSQDAASDYLEELKVMGETDKEINKSWDIFNKYIADRFNPASDTNITEVDVSSDTKSGKNPNTQLYNDMSGLSQYLKEKSKALLPAVEQKVKIHFSTANKAQVEVAGILASTVNSQIDNGQEAKMANRTNNDYAIIFNRPSNTYTISYDTMDKSRNTIEVEAALMPPKIRESVNEAKNNWQTDPKNPHASLPSFSFKTPMIQDQKEIIQRSFLTNFKTENVAFNQFVLTNLSQTTDEIIENLKVIYPSITNDKIDEIGNFLNSTRIEVKPKLIDGRFYLFPTEITSTENSDEYKRVEFTQPLGEVDHRLSPESLLREQARQLLEYRNNKIMSILRKK